MYERIIECDELNRLAGRDKPAADRPPRCGKRDIGGAITAISVACARSGTLKRVETVCGMFPGWFIGGLLCTGEGRAWLEVDSHSHQLHHHQSTQSQPNTLAMLSAVAVSPISRRLRKRKQHNAHAELRSRDNRDCLRPVVAALCLLAPALHNAC